MGKKTFWIINQYALLDPKGGAGRRGHLARELAARGHDVVLVAASWTHWTDGSQQDAPANARPTVEQFENFRFVRLPVPRYKHSRDKRRVLNWLLFSWRVSRLDRLLPEKPDAILCSSPSPFVFLGAERIARRLKARLVFEVRDIWPLTLVELGGIRPTHPMIRLMQRIEDRAYRVSDHVVSNLQGAVDHMVGRGLDPARFSWIPNGFSRQDIFEEEAAPPEIAEHLDGTAFTVGYAGTCAGNGLWTLLQAAEQLAREPVKFIIIGRGHDKAALQDYAVSRNLDNVRFFDHIPKRKVFATVRQFDVAYSGAKHSPLYAFGIAANKLFDYFMAARPILFSYSGRYGPVAAYDAGITVEADDPNALAQAVLTMKAMSPEERRRLGENGRRAALERHDYAVLAERLEAVLCRDA